MNAATIWAIGAGTGVIILWFFLAMYEGIPT
jgi:hypothetical protein